MNTNKVDVDESSLLSGRLISKTQFITSIAMVDANGKQHDIPTKPIDITPGDSGVYALSAAVVLLWEQIHEMQAKIDSLKQNKVAGIHE